MNSDPSFCVQRLVSHVGNWEQGQKRGWLKRRIQEAANEYDNWPDTMKEAMRIKDYGSDEKP